MQVNGALCLHVYANNGLIVCEKAIDKFHLRIFLHFVYIVSYAFFNIIELCKIKLFINSFRHRNFLHLECF